MTVSWQKHIPSCSVNEAVAVGIGAAIACSQKMTDESARVPVPCRASHETSRPLSWSTCLLLKERTVLYWTKGGIPRARCDAKVTSARDRKESQGPSAQLRAHTQVMNHGSRRRRNSSQRSMKHRKSIVSSHTVRMYNKLAESGRTGIVNPVIAQCRARVAGMFLPRRPFTSPLPSWLKRWVG
ncbi:hypothetical protein J6590_016946 [Homalodisca vitripennis]|nr:hypothetical protein J6590_016946 [Homalodisca vitripennis]